MALWVLLMVPEVAVNVALLWPAATVTLDGTESNRLLLAIDTPESVVTAVSKLTVHLTETLLVIAEGEQNRDVGCVLVVRWALSVKVCEPPFRLAVSKAP